jgi:cell division protein FtsB
MWPDATVRTVRAAVPTWAVILMIAVLMSGVCLSLSSRGYTEVQTATQEHQKLTVEVESLRTNSALLKNEVARLRNDPETIEAAARSRLNMVRENEIIVPVGH